MDPRPHLRALAEALPPGSAVSVPREWLLELLAAQTSGMPAPAEYTVEQLADRLGRAPSTIRTWLEKGEFADVYKFRGREWRIPAASVEAFEAKQRPAPPVPRSPAPPVVSLDRWTREA